MKKTKVALNKKLALNKETITAMSPEQQHLIEGGLPQTEGFCMSGSGCDCQRATCGINPCTPPFKDLQDNGLQ